MARLAELEQENANIRQQIEEWQGQRRAKKEHSRDWEAFRRHLAAIGAPDPGPHGPQQFYLKLPNR